MMRLLSFYVVSLLATVARGGPGGTCPEAIPLTVNGPSLGYSLDCSPTACMSSSNDLPCPCATATYSTGQPLTGPPPAWIEGPAFGDPYSRGGWFEFTTPPTTAVITISTNTPTTLIDSTLALYASCPGSNSEALSIALAWDDDNYPTSQVVPGVATVPLTVVAANDTFCPSGLCSSIQTAQLSPSTTYYVHVRAVSDPGSPSFTTDPIASSSAQFGVGVVSEALPLCGTACGVIPNPTNTTTCPSVVDPSGICGTLPTLPTATTPTTITPTLPTWTWTPWTIPTSANSDCTAAPLCLPSSSCLAQCASSSDACSYATCQGSCFATYCPDFADYVCCAYADSTTSLASCALDGYCSSGSLSAAAKIIIAVVITVLIVVILLVLLACWWCRREPVEQQPTVVVVSKGKRGGDSSSTSSSESSAGPPPSSTAQPFTQDVVLN